MSKEELLQIADTHEFEKALINSNLNEAEQVQLIIERWESLYNLS